MEEKIKTDDTILKNLRFSHLNRCYDIEFNYFRIVQIWGNSATGKSLFLQDFKSEYMLTPGLKNSLIIDCYTGNNLSLLKTSAEYSYVIIDNADTILTPEYQKIIKKKIIDASDTYWIVLGRKYFECVIATICVGEMKHVTDKNGNIKFFVDYGGI